LIAQGDSNHMQPAGLVSLLALGRFQAVEVCSIGFSLI
jgi:hypothetical protein